MTKSTTGDKPPAKPEPRPEAPPGREEERPLREYYNLGVKAHNACLGKDRRGCTEVFRILATGAYPEFIVRQARLFARKYSVEEFEQLCRLRTPKGRPLTFSHARPLTTVEDKAQRAALQERAARGGWGVDRLKKEIRRTKGGPGSNGRPPVQVPKTLADLICSIEMQTEGWLVRHEKAWGGGKSELFQGVRASTKDERAELRASLERVLALLRRLGDGARDLEGRMEKIKIRMGPAERTPAPEPARGRAGGRPARRTR